ncbi:hypothetical protein TA5113_00595 [Cognatishimia activa]|nr:hypothetical protein TA5113_00595 [Cognatishimia activa]
MGWSLTSQPGKASTPTDEDDLAIIIAGHKLRAQLDSGSILTGSINGTISLLPLTPDLSFLCHG